MTNHYKRNIYYISVSGVFLGLTLIFQYISRFMPLVPGVADVNLSLVFIVPLFFITPFYYGFFVLVARFAIGPAFSTTGYSLPSLWGHFVLFLAAIIFISILLIFKKYKLLHIKKHFIKLSIFISIISCSILMALFNALFITPIYYWVFNLIDSPSFILLQSMWDQYYEIYFFISNYWAAIFAVYISLNLINYSIAGVLFYFVNSRLKWTHIQPVSKKSKLDKERAN